MTDQGEIPKGNLWIGISEDGKEVIVNHPDLERDARGMAHIVFSPAQALGLANLLTNKANVILGRVCGHCGDALTDETGWATARFRYCFKPECQQEFYAEAQSIIRTVDPEMADKLAAATKQHPERGRCDHARDRAFTPRGEGKEVCTLCKLVRAVFTCPDCHRTSHNPNDARERYCGACHKFFK